MAVTLADFKLVYTNSKLSDTQLQKQLDMAKLIVDEDLRSKCPMSEDRYNMIQIYLAAHFATMAEQAASGLPGALKRSRLGEADESYDIPGTDSHGLGTSSWGQMAIALDKCGILLRMAKRNLRAQFRVIGDNPVTKVIAP